MRLRTPAARLFCCLFQRLSRSPLAAREESSPEERKNNSHLVCRLCVCTHAHQSMYMKLETHSWPLQLPSEHSDCCIYTRVPGWWASMELYSWCALYLIRKIILSFKCSPSTCSSNSMSLTFFEHVGYSLVILESITEKFPIIKRMKYKLESPCCTLHPTNYSCHIWAFLFFDRYLFFSLSAPSDYDSTLCFLELDYVRSHT